MSGEEHSYGAAMALTTLGPKACHLSPVIEAEVGGECTRAHARFSSVDLMEITTNNCGGPEHEDLGADDESFHWDPYSEDEDEDETDEWPQMKDIANPLTIEKGSTSNPPIDCFDNMDNSFDNTNNESVINLDTRHTRRLWLRHSASEHLF